MITNDRVRNMTPSEKMKDLLTRLTDDLPRTAKDKIIEEISKLAKGTDPAEFLKKFNLEGTYDAGTNGDAEFPAINVMLDEGKMIKIEISDLERHWFLDPQPVEPQPPRSILPQDELDELNHG